MRTGFLKKTAAVIATALTLGVFNLGLSVMASSNASSSSQGSAVKEEIKSLTLEEMKGKVTEGKALIVDTRRNDSFIGWALEGVKRGGHIKGAKDFASNWLTTDNEKKEEILKETMETKGIVPGKEIILYDATGKDAPEVKKYFESKGISDIKYFNINEWADDESLELEKYPNYSWLVAPEILKEIIDGKKPERFENAKNIKVVEASWGALEGKADEMSPYVKGHIKGAPHINTDSIEPPPAWMLADDETLIKFLNEYGFSPDDTVIVTGKDVLASYRVFYVLRYCGIKDVRILNGGTDAYEKLGYPLDTEIVKPTPGTAYTSADQFNKDLVTSQQELKDLIGKPGYVLVDDRTWEEFIGKDSGYSYHKIAGRIPGAVFGYAGKTGEGSSSVTYFENIDKTMRNAEEIKELWESQGINLNEERIDTMCGSGWRAAEVTTFFNVLGMENVKMFSDGWIGWSMNPENKDKGITGEPSEKPKYLK